MYTVYCEGYKLGERLSINCVTQGRDEGWTAEIRAFPVDEKVFKYLSTTPLGVFGFPHEINIELYREYTHNGFPKREHQNCKLIDLELIRMPMSTGDKRLYLKGTLTGDLSFVFLGGN